MNSHLNLFKSYAKENRSYQLENDLTRALAICLQENTLFFNEILKNILDEIDSKELFNDIYSKNDISINIQKSSSDIDGFEKIYAVSLSEFEMTESHFWNQKHEAQYEPVCDLVININGIAIIIEAKRDNWDCTSQLYNQVFNICSKNNIPSTDMNQFIVPKDLNWPKLMGIAVKVHSFEKAASNPSRFLADFISLVSEHNYRWLPIPSIFSVSSDNSNIIKSRIDAALSELESSKGLKKLNYNDRMGLLFNEPWAKELLFYIKENGDLSIAIYPGNTKAQGNYIFQNNPKPKKSICIDNDSLPLTLNYHIKFTSFQRYFTGLWFNDTDLLAPLYTKENFIKYSGRKKKGEDWEAIELLFNDIFNTEFDWKSYCKWDTKVIGSNRTQFDMSFGYDVSVTIPFETLRKKDKDKSDITSLSNFIYSIYSEFRNIY